MLLLAGHDTTTSSMTWFFYKLVKHPKLQVHIREEIAAVHTKSTSKNYTVADLNSMTYTQAALKVMTITFPQYVRFLPTSCKTQESLRLHPIFWTLKRKANKDDVIPLAFPITTEMGEQITSIPIKKGTPIDISTTTYNR